MMRVALVGGGVIGGGWAGRLVENGVDVVVYDPHPETERRVREVDQLARWLTEEPYRKLVTRSNLAARARSARGMPARRPVHTILSSRHSSPVDGVIEAVVVVQGPARTRAVALRLEGMDGRWRATSLALL